MQQDKSTQFAQQNLPKGGKKPHDPLVECLIVIAKSHELPVERDVVVAGLPLDNKGLTPSLFPRAAKKAGFSSRIVSLPLVQLNSALFPVILLLKENDACVLHRLDVSSGKAFVSFSELGDAPVELPIDDIDSRFTGTAIYIRPEFRYDGRTPEVRNLKRRHWFWSVIEENKPLYKDILAAAVMINLFALAMPLFIRNVYDRVLPNLAVETLWVTSAAVLLALGGDIVLRLMRVYFIDLSSSRADVKLSSSIMEQVLGLRLEHRPASVGSFASNLQAFEFVRNFITSSTIAVLVDLPFASLFIIVIALISWPLVIPVLLGVAAVFLYAMTIQGKMHDLTEQSYRVGAQRSATLIEGLTGIETIKAVNAENSFQARWEKVVARLAKVGEQLRFLSASVSSGAYMVQTIVSILGFIVGVYLISSGNLTMGGLIAVYILTSRVMSPVSQSAALLVQYHQAETSLTSLNTIMELPVERPVDAGFVSRKSCQGNIEFRDVHFAYPNQEREALSGVSFRIRQGEHVAILGRIGSGKTTIERLIAGLYQPKSGTVFIDGIDIRQVDPMELRNHIGYVSQEAMLFFGSLRDNITLGYPQASDQEVLRAASIGTLDQFVDKHPHGFNMQVGERGEFLSGGQRQGVVIARAVINDPSILLFDEPTSQMDNTTEGIFKTRFEQYVRQKTVLIVTHRTSLLNLVDRIIVMDGGKVVADGPKEKVLDALKKGQIRRVET